MLALWRRPRCSTTTAIDLSWSVTSTVPSRIRVRSCVSARVEDASEVFGRERRQHRSMEALEVGMAAYRTGCRAGKDAIRRGAAWHQAHAATPTATREPAIIVVTLLRFGT